MLDDKANQVDRNRIGGQPYLVTSNQNDRRPLIGPVNPQTTGSFANTNHNNQQPSTRFVFQSNNHPLAATGPYAHLQPQANSM
ncbi:hypothetical protein PtA15_13A371 [Puccinia triticina]|uniref:Uncharacterized protein n=1 Tax=Puccinia triticina TaxID=208348 RepID=A0ABY7D3Q8_9BASI|nr:uncharacterized protein PtA15_13A371 [Puccinia triticina]WAQ90971.1 hypothetical protein PtA15_13A371 [Puccinia triticina]